MKATYLYLSLALLTLTLLTSCGPDANKPTPQPTPQPTPEVTHNVTLLNKLDGKKHPAGKTIDYVATISKDVKSYTPELFFSVLKTKKYTVSLKFDQPISGSICLGENCIPATDQSNFGNTIDLLADGEESVFPPKEKNQPTSLGAHIDINTPAGETYKNRLTIQLKPADGGETLSWTVNLAIAVK